jgi:hypothetical protein
MSTAAEQTDTKTEVHGAYTINETADGTYEVTHKTRGPVGGAPDLQEARNLITDAGGRLKQEQPKATDPSDPYTCKIVCAKRGCKEVRMVKPQDVFQVKFCQEHQKEAARERARDRRRAKAAAAPAKVPPVKGTKAKSPAKAKAKPATVHDLAAQREAAIKAGDDLDDEQRHTLLAANDAQAQREAAQV